MCNGFAVWLPHLNISEKIYIAFGNLPKKKKTISCGSFFHIFFIFSSGIHMRKKEEARRMMKLNILNNKNENKDISIREWSKPFSENQYLRDFIEILENFNFTYLKMLQLKSKRRNCYQISIKINGIFEDVSVASPPN